MKIARTILKRLREPRSLSPSHSAQPSEASANLHPPASRKRRVLHLTRSAERLDRVERRLIARMSRNFEIDTETHELLRELSVTTNRLKGQILQMERDGNAADE